MTEPRWMLTARKYLGLREVPGPGNNTTIIGWLSRLKAWWKDDATPWCGAFVAHVMQDVGQPYPKEWQRAKAWADWGARLLPERLAPGAVLVFGRTGGGHVGFYVGEDATHYRVLGGNQGDAVSETWIAKNRLIAARWPKGEPVNGRPVMLARNGAAVSRNEA